ncbi:MAG: hypothetical protein JWO38_1801 [Gemmataceae bacterium]|nr:hypothetical protein [Gemmataceae bacterium]
MNRFWTSTAAVVGLVIGGTAEAHDGKSHPSGGSGSPPPLVVNGSGNGTGNKIEVDPSAGQKVVINASGNGTGNTIVVEPDPHGKVIINASGNGTGNKIVVEQAPGEKVVIRGSGNGKNNNVVIVKVPGPDPVKPQSAGSQGKSGGQHHHSRR